MDLKKIKDLYKFLRKTDIVELEHEDEKSSIKIKRQGAVSAPVAQPVQPSIVAAPQPLVAAGVEVEEKKETLKENVKVINSPMVGTFYRSASPESPSFVENGTVVKSGQIICIIEAMKIMNEIESDYNGKIVSVLVENGQPIEYGEPLFHVEV